MERPLKKPDILDCLANLSADEVFTPPWLANQMLDMVPDELWSNPNAKFLDPFTKSGVFLREIVKRLDKGLELAIPDKEARIRHILGRQVYGIAITRLTSLFARRTLYCNKDARSNLAAIQRLFKDKIGLIAYRPCQHSWVNGACRVCGASKKTYLDGRSEDVENYAYPFLHDEELVKMAEDLRFDLVIGNPPYQLTTAGAENGAQAKPIYQLFVQQARKLNPKFLVMITPARWFSGGWGLDEFREEMIHDNKLRVVHDFWDATSVFPGMQIKGGVCYFLWSRDSEGKCKFITHAGSEVTSDERYLKEAGVDALIRFNKGVSIYHKVKGFNERSMMEIVSSQKPFGLGTAFHGDKVRGAKSIKVYENGGSGYINIATIPKGEEAINKFKVYISAAYGAGEGFPHQIINKPFVGEKGSCCTETYVMVGPCDTEEAAKNLCGYMKTKFFRFLVMLLKNSQHALKKVYQLVPIQDFSKPWTDEELYKKYKLTEDEIEFIESMIKPMEEKK